MSKIISGTEDDDEWTRMYENLAEGMDPSISRYVISVASVGERNAPVASLGTHSQAGLLNALAGAENVTPPPPEKTELPNAYKGGDCGQMGKKKSGSTKKRKKSGGKKKKSGVTRKRTSITKRKKRK